MSDLLTDCAIRISQADPERLREIYYKEILAPIWTDDERATLMEAFDLRASFHNRMALGVQVPRW